MSSIKKLTLAYFALGAISASAVAAGLFAHFANDGNLARGWILPLCLATAAGATLVARFERRALRGSAPEPLSGPFIRNR